VIVFICAQDAQDMFTFATMILQFQYYITGAL